MERTLYDDTTAEGILARFSDLENNPHETISPYLHFNVNGKLYYFTPGGFLYRREPGTEEIGGIFCGYLTDEVWRYRTDYDVGGGTYTNRLAYFASLSAIIALTFASIVMMLR